MTRRGRKEKEKTTQSDTLPSISCYLPTSQNAKYAYARPPYDVISLNAATRQRDERSKAEHRENAKTAMILSRNKCHGRTGYLRSNAIHVRPSGVTVRRRGHRRRGRHFHPADPAKHPTKQPTQPYTLHATQHKALPGMSAVSPSRRQRGITR